MTPEGQKSIIEIFDECHYADLLQIYSRALRVWRMPQRGVDQTIATLEGRLAWLRDLRDSLARYEAGSDRPLSVEMPGPADVIVQSHLPEDLQASRTRRGIRDTDERFEEILWDWDINPMMCWQTMASIMDERALWLRRQTPVLQANGDRVRELHGRVVSLR
ncbi:hypothetical protein [Lentisalinibacter sediminis]|uniref:hypothetical protein n=1 Tax=Lentisalinibacter sediminis TaxID=2992237 RepID=UPI00386C966D